MAAGQNLAELDNRIKIRDNIQAGRVQESIALVNEQHPALLDSDRYLLFHLQQQQLIELIREQVCCLVMVMVKMVHCGKRKHLDVKTIFSASGGSSEICSRAPC